MIKRVIFSLILLFSTLFILPNTAYAVCPVCTVAVGAGLGLSRALGIDDAVTSVWIGGLILSMSYWLIDWIKRKKKLENPNPTMEAIVIVSMYLLTLIPLYLSKFIGRPNNTFLGIDKILLGTIFGTGAFLLGKWVDAKVREKVGKQLFFYQKVIFPVVALLLTSLILHFIIGY